MPDATAYSIADLPPHLAQRVTVDGQSGCWRVGGYHDDDGYAYYHTSAGRIGAHRAAWIYLIGEIPADRPILDHVRSRGCVWRDCIWPAHLEPVTVRINTLRGTGPAAVNAAKTHCSTCKTAFDLFNTYVTPDGRRNCRRCNRAAVARYQERRRGKPVTVTPVIELVRAA